MKVDVKFERYESETVWSPIFSDSDGNEYLWPEDDSGVSGAHKGFWDQLGYNKNLRYSILASQVGSKLYVSKIYKIK
jgi:hypothetical protein